MATQIRRLTVVLLAAALAVLAVATWARFEEMTADWVMVPTQH